MSLTPAIDISNINEKVYDYISKRIINLTYPPGRRIDVGALERELGVSHTPIKDALFRLAGEGMIEIRSRRGTFVKEISESDVLEIYDARLVLEGGAVEMAAETVTDEQLIELQRLYLTTLEDFELENNRKFHLAIIGLTGNQKLIDIYRRLSAHMQIVRFWLARMGQTKLPFTAEDHLRILDALRERNPRYAKEAVINHIVRSREAFLKPKSV